MFSCVISFGLLFNPYSAHADITSNLAGKWTFDTADTTWSASTTADTSGNGNTGSLTNFAGSANTIAGPINQGLSFDGVNDYVNFGTTNSFNFTSSDFTLSLWYKGADINLNDMLVSRGTYNGAGYQIYFSQASSGQATQITVVLHSGNNQVTQSNANLLNGVWYHLVFVRFPTQMKIFVNAVELGYLAHPTITNPTSYIGSLLLGQDNAGGSNPSMSLDDVRIYSRALTTTDITQLYNLGYTPTVTTSAASSVTDITAVLNGNISVINATASSTVRGFAYGTDSALNTVIATTTETGTFGTGSFSTTTLGLSGSTTYYFRAYASTVTSTGYGSIQSFSTNSSVTAPTLSTSPPTLVSTSTMTLNGSITADGNASSTIRGFAWGTNSNLSGGDTATTTETPGPFGLGAFTKVLTSLTPNTLYYFRAYAVNSAGTSTGAILSTTTLQWAVPGAPTGVTATAGNTQASVTFIAPASNGGSPITGYTVTSNPAGGTDTNAGTTGLTHTVTGLANGISYTFTVTATNIIGTGSASSASSPVTPYTLASISTSFPPLVSTSTLTLNANITNDGGASTTIRGFAYGTDSTLTTGAATTTELGTFGTGAFTKAISSLTPNTLYYFRAYTVNLAGTSTGAILSTTTLPVSAPSVTTQAGDTIAATTATGHGTITSTGNINAATRGVVYGTSSSYGATTTPENGNFSTGTYTASITGLTCNTLYHVAAYATNSQGISYGNDVQFTTTACIQTLTTNLPTLVSSSTITLNASITATGGADATASGFAYGTVANLSTVIATTSDGAQTGTASFIHPLSSLTPNTIYYFRAYAVNSAGTSTGAILSTTTLALSVPTVLTGTTTSLTQTTATLNGSVDGSGNLDATQHGFAYSTDNTLATTIATTTEGSFVGTGAITSNISSLTCNTTYYARAYAQNRQGTGYGTIQPFTTSICPAVVTPPPSGGSSSSGGSSPYTWIRQPDGTYLPVIRGNNVVQQVVNNIIPGLLNPTVPAPEPTQVATTTGSLPLANNWDLLNPSIANNFTLGPLPSQLTDLIHKFPKLGITFTNLGVKTVADISKLQGTSFDLPSIADLKTLPAEVVVAEDSSRKIGVTSSVTLLDTGAVQQKIETVANTNLTLAVKPIAPADAVTGYLIFRKSAPKTALELPFGSQAAAAVLATQKTLAVTTTTIPSSDLLVNTFSYTDPEHTGIYTANVTTPAVEGTYEVITLISYHDKTLGTKELRLTTVVDPEGHVYEMIQGKEALIPNATVSIYNSNTNVLWDAGTYSQTNPQTTDTSGKYSFLVPEGKYYITVEATGYDTYQGNTFDVKAGNGVHFNIELTPARSIISLFSWSTILIIILAIALLATIINDLKYRKRRLARN
jgi:hypothetical protein